jgi:hypothetical protein
MSNLNKVLLSGLLLFLPLTIIEARESRQKHHHKIVTLQDLKGTYVGIGATAGGSQLTSSANVFTAKIREDGTGFIPSDAARVFESGQTFFEKFTTPPTAVPPDRGALTVKVNRDGTGKMLIYGFPTLNDIVHLELVMIKQNGRVVKFYGLLKEIEGPSANTPVALGIKLFTFERQFD